MYQLDLVSDIKNGILGVLFDIGQGILNFIINLIITLINLVLLPINVLVDSIFPDLGNQINSFNYALERFLTAPFYIFTYLIPPLTKTVILIYLGILLAYYSIIMVYRGCIFVPTFIRRIKFW